MTMNRKSALLGTSVALMSAVLISPLINSALTQANTEPSQNRLTPPPASTKSYAKAEDVWTYDCEFPVQRPEQITLTCADGGMIVTGIKWQSWNQNGAIGSGTYSQNMCEPNCAEGKRVSVPVRLKLSELFEYKGRNMLRSLDIRAMSGRELPNGKSGFQWDISEFAVQVNWDM